MNIKDQLSTDLKEAMKARDQLLIDTLRSVMSAFTYKRTEKNTDLTDEEMLAVIQKQVKQRNDSIAEYTKASRMELAEKEIKEKDILTKYLPAQKSEKEIRDTISSIVNSMPKEERNQGNIMKTVMPQLKGLADGNLIRQIVTEEIQKN